MNLLKSFNFGFYNLKITYNILYITLKLKEKENLYLSSLNHFIKIKTF